MLRENYTPHYPPAASELNYTNRVVNALQKTVENMSGGTSGAPRIETDPDGTTVLVFGE